MSKPQKVEKLNIKPTIINLNSESSDIYMEMTMCILTNQTNLNKLRFTDDYINGVVENKEKFIGIPLVVNREKLENGLYNNLTHELDIKTKQLKTDSIGSFVDFWSEEDEDGALLLMGLVRVYKRYPHVCNAIIELYNSGELEFSCEMLAYGYADIDEETGTRTVNYEYEGQVNSLFGSCIVSDPAEPKSKAMLLVAEALIKDLEGGETMSDINTQEFNKGFEIRYHGELNLSSIKFSDISNSIYNQLNPVNPKTNYRSYNYYILDMYLDYVIVEEWDDSTTLWRIPYKIENNQVIISPAVDWEKGRMGFIPDGVDIDALIEAVKNSETELNSKINELTNKHKEELELNEEQVKEVEAQIEGLKKQVAELNELVVSQKEEIVALKDKETELNSIIENLKPYKEQVETAEKNAKKAQLQEKFSKILSEELMKTEDVKNAIEELDETKLNEIVVNHIVKEKTKTNNKEKHSEEDVIVTASRLENLIPEDLKTRLYAEKN